MKGQEMNGMEIHDVKDAKSKERESLKMSSALRFPQNPVGQTESAELQVQALRDHTWRPRVLEACGAPGDPFISDPT